MARSTRFSSRLARALVCVCASACAAATAQTGSTAGGAEAPPVNPDAEWVERSRELLERAAAGPPPDWLRMELSEEALQWAEAVAAEAAGRLGEEPLAIEGAVPRPFPEGEPAQQEETVLVFGSFSMPEITLRNLLDQSAEANVVFVLRGLAQGIDILNTQARIEALVDIGRGRVPNVLIDPTLFQRFNVTVAPTLVLLRDGVEGTRPVRVTGAVPVDWLRRQARRVSDTDAVDLGRRAEVHEIAETDLIVEMQRRLAEVDFEAQRQAAIDGFWRSGHTFLDLPDAPADAEFAVDPTVTITDNITDPNGRVLVAAGERYNPLDIVPMTKTVVVFRGTDARHRAKAAELAAEIRHEGGGVILLTTVVDTEAGWDSLNAMETVLQGPVYLLMPNVAERFHLRHAPATVSARDRHLVVQEYALPALGRGVDNERR